MCCCYLANNIEVLIQQIKRNKNMKNIILLTDFSESARNACIYAMNLFGHEDVQYILMNTYLDLNFDAYPVVSILKGLRERSLKELENELTTLNAEKPDLLLNFHKESMNSEPLEGIHKLCEKDKYDYVVMGTMGKAESNWFLGSTALEVTRDSPVPVFVIPKDAKFRTLSKIIYTSDLHIADSLMINNLVSVAKLKNASITILHVDTVSKNTNGSIEELEKMIKESAYESINFVELEGEEIEKTIIDYIDDVHADLLVITTRTTTFFKKIFHRSHTKKILLQSHFPMLIYNEKNQE